MLPSKRIKQILEGIKKGEITGFKEYKDKITDAIIHFLNEEYVENNIRLLNKSYSSLQCKVE